MAPTYIIPNTQAPNVTFSMTSIKTNIKNTINIAANTLCRLVFNTATSHTLNNIRNPRITSKWSTLFSITLFFLFDTDSFHYQYHATTYPNFRYNCGTLGATDDVYQTRSLIHQGIL